MHFLEEEPDYFTVLPAEEGIRLDKILAQRYQEIQSRTYFHSLFDASKILLNHLPVKKSCKPKCGDEIQVSFILTPEIHLEPENIPLNIVYEDEFILIVNKPAGMVVHPAPGNWQGTFANALLFHCKGLFEEFQSVDKKMWNELPRPGIVHRLDKDTSGLLVSGKTLMAQQKMMKLFAERQVNKQYRAICIGNPGKGQLDQPIGRHPVHRKLMAVVPGGKRALTFYETLASTSDLSYVNVDLATGRTHQIRVHMNHLKCPILGDATYGDLSKNKKFAVSRQLLHAYALKFQHPFKNKEIDLKAPLPHDMSSILNKYFKDYAPFDSTS